MIPFLVLALLSVVGAITAWAEFHEVVSDVKVLNPEGDKGTALVIYQKGLRDFQPKAAYAFAGGLASSGWRVDVTTVSHRAPTDISRYDLLVLGWPTYWFFPSPPVKCYLRRIGDLERKNTVIICTASGVFGCSCERMKRLVQAVNGTVVHSLKLFTIRPNEGYCDPLDMAARIGKNIPLP